MPQHEWKEGEETRVVVSFGDLIRDTQQTRMIPILAPDEVPEGVGVVVDPELGTKVPAIIAVSLKFSGVARENGVRVAQWSAWVTPWHSKVLLKLSRDDVRGIIEDVCRDLTERCRPGSGAILTAYFTVPAGATQNILIMKFRRTRRLWNADANPWREDPRRKLAVEVSQERLDTVLRLIWNSWTAAEDIRPVLVAQNVPVGANSGTVYRGFDIRAHIEESLPATARGTYFYHCELEELDGNEASPPRRNVSRGTVAILFFAGILLIWTIALICTR